MKRTRNTGQEPNGLVGRKDVEATGVDHARDAAQAADPASVPPAPWRPSSRRRLWLFRCLAVFALPLLVLGLLEVTLRLCGFGYRTCFYLHAQVNGDRVCVQNDDFSRRCFPIGLQRHQFPFMLRDPKPQGVCRIVVLGSSAAMGDPEPMYGIGRVLEAQLRARYPGVEFEVVNAAMTAINSHLVRDIAQDCLALQPDAFVIYCGNNEVVGPFGPGTVFGDFVPSLRMIRANLALRRTRVDQFISAGVAALRPRKGHEVWRGLQMFLGHQVPEDAPALTAVYDHFGSNLEAVCRAIGEQHVPTILCTVATNLKDCAPLTAMHRTGLTKLEEDQWDQLYAAGAQSEAVGDVNGARQAYAQAAAIDDRHANLQFRLGRVCAALGDWDAAYSAYVRARDLDTLRLRADTRINEAIRGVAGDQRWADVHLVDAARGFAEASSHGLPGSDLFLEHVHLTFKGNCLLARLVLAELEGALPAWVRERKDSPELLTDEQVAADMGFTSWDRLQIAERVLNGYLKRAPFTNQLDHAAMISDEEQRVAGLWAALDEPALRQAAQTYEAAIARRPNDFRLRFMYGRFLAATGRLADAAREMGAALQLFPDYNGDLLNELAVVLSRQGRFGDAQPLFERVLRLLPYNAANHCNYALALAQGGQYEQARSMFEDAVKLDPSDDLTQQTYGMALQAAGQTGEALPHLREAVRLAPDNAEARIKLGGVLQAAGEVSDAISEFSAAAELRPGWPPVRQALNRAYIARAKMQPDVQAAVADWRRAIDVAPEDAESRYGLGLTLARSAEYAAAVTELREALRRRPESAAIMAELAWILATSPADEVRNLREALELAERAVGGAGRQEARALDVLAAAYAEAGRFEEALGTIDTAIARAVESHPELVQQLKHRREWYAAGQPFRSVAGAGGSGATGGRANGSE